MQMAAYIAKFAAIFVWFVWLCSNVQIVHFKSDIANICKFVLQILMKIIFYEMHLVYQVINTSRTNRVHKK